MSLFGLIFGALAAGNAVKEKITYFDDEAYKADSNNPNITITELVRRRNSGYYTKVLTPSNREQKEIYELKQQLEWIYDHRKDAFRRRKQDLWWIDFNKDLVEIEARTAEPIKEGVRTNFSMLVEELETTKKRFEISEKMLKEDCEDFIRTESKLRQLDPTYKRTEEVEAFAKNVEEFLKEHRGK